MVELDKDMNKRMQSYRMTRDHESQFEWSLSSDFLGFKLQQYAKPPFPYFLEEVRLNYCNNLSGSSLAVISLLGPQLKSLSMDAVSDIGNDEVAKLLSHCTNVRSLSLKDTNITDQLLQLLAKAMDTHSTPSNQGLITIAPLKSLEIPGTEISDDGLVPLIRAIKGDLETFVIGDNYDITSETLFALVEDCQTTAGTQLGKATGNLGEQESEPAQLSKRIFVPNTVLTTIMFAGDFGIGDDGFTTLFQYATELKIIKLERCELEDEPLLALAETNRKRIENQGLGIPKAWYNHDLGDKRFELQSKSKKGRRKNKQPAPKFYTGGKVITNRGIRAIVRSCVKLEHLELVECSIVTMRVFRGPWVCNDIQSLNISGIRLRIPMELEFELVDEELCEIERFRIEPIKNFKKGLDFHADGTYDFLAAPIIDDPEFEVDEDFYRIMSANWGHGYNEDDEDDEDFENLWNDEDDWEGNLSDDDDDEDDEDDYDDYDSLDGRPYILGYPPRRYRNQTAHRMTMREFYTKLGQFKKLRSLDMSDADYRIRLHDGLHLALPGLRQSLQWWDITRHPKYRVEDDELIWIGKHFGYGSNYSDPYDEDQWEDVDEDEDEDEDEGEDKDGDEGKDEDEDEDTPKPRLGKLECLRISHYAAEGLDSGVAMWFEDQGIRLDLSYD
ncbi:hypothetical protein BGX31_003975 [Mortierella sp. GBA43]|nr:hypothetical protein BGX31_003975 [Mortierella sp. GBA43]